MRAISDDFKTAMKQPVKELQAFIAADAVTIRDEDHLISFKVSCEGGLFKSAMRKLEAKYLGEHNLLGQWITAGFGVKLASGAFEYLNYGSFLVSELTFEKDTGMTTIVAHDKMVNAMRAYDPIEIEYPVDLYTYTQKLCEACDLELGNSFDTNGDWQIERELWENINGITYRDIFAQIAQATASICLIGTDDKVHFKQPEHIGENLTYDNMIKLKLEPMYGAVNSVVLARTPAEDNVYLRDEESVALNGVVEVKIENNEILDRGRETAIQPIFDAVRGMFFYPFETTTEGHGWYDIGDMIDVVNDAGDVFQTIVLNYSVQIDGGIKETLKAAAETKTQTQYQYATSIAKRVKNTEIIVNKQEQYIKQIVSDMDGVVNEKFTEIYQNIDEIVASVQNSGGGNMIKNSVMFAHTDGAPADWEVDEGGELSIGSDTEAMANGGQSGHSFTLIGKTVRQRVSVQAYNETNGKAYTFSTKIKKDAVGSCYVKLYNDIDDYIIEIPTGASAFYEDFEIKAIKPSMNYLIVEFYGSADGVVSFTDNMLAVGEYKSQWAQANGEVMNTQVNINLDGILVRSSVYLGDYTVVSPLEFAGYSSINGTPTKVFSLNKDVTYVKKLEADDEIKMIPIKIVPITEGDLQGWAFVPAVKGVE